MSLTTWTVSVACHSPDGYRMTSGVFWVQAGTADAATSAPCYYCGDPSRIPDEMAPGPALHGQFIRRPSKDAARRPLRDMDQNRNRRHKTQRHGTTE